MTLALASPFADHMVLQRERRTRLWGWDRPNQSIAIALELEPEGTAPARLVFETTLSADDGGAFACDLPALYEKGPYRLRVEGSSVAVVRDILAGDVWLACGQSNMEWTVAQAGDAEREIPNARHPEIRCLYVARAPARTPAKTVACRWFPVSPETVRGMTAVGYFFAREIQRELGVPIGIVDAAWGGTRVEAWTSAETLPEVLSLAAERARFELPEPELARAKAEHAAALARWEAANLPADPENLGVAWGWASPEFDDRDFQELVVPGMWQREGLNFNGAVWYRREFELPAGWEQLDLTLCLGAIDDFDHTYVNGELVGANPKGTPEAFQIQRRYRVPAALLRPGKNLLAVRIFDHMGEGGFVGPSQELYLERAGEPGQRVPLAGRYRVGVEREVPLVPLSVFASYPPPPPPLQPQNAPAALYNGMLAPLVPFGLRGALFYQGEENTWTASTYAPRFAAMIRDFRARFEQGPLPFYFVELAGFRAHDGWPRLREAQAAALAEPATGMASAIDIGDPNDIHPRNKLEVGRRLAALALSGTYGKAGVPCSGPVLATLSLRGRECRFDFTHAEGLRTSDGAAVRAFEVAGPSGEFVDAPARIEGEAVIVTSPNDAPIRAVRYAFRDYADVNLVNGAGLPARPFRTDHD